MAQFIEITHSATGEKKLINLAAIESINPENVKDGRKAVITLLPDGDVITIIETYADLRRLLNSNNKILEDNQVRRAPGINRTGLR